MKLRPSADKLAADWIALQRTEWHELAKFGPVDRFDAHARVLYAPDSDSDDWDEIRDSRRPGFSDAEILAEICDALSTQTSSTDQCYFCLWDGWPGVRDLVERAALVQIPNRTYYLFEGPLKANGRWGDAPTPYMPPASFVWPADHAWCIASDVDVSWAGVSASRDGIAALRRQPRLRVAEANPKDW